jgi:hypothetical protein
VRASLLVASFASIPILLAPASARANGRFPSANQFVVAPSDPNTQVLRTTFGFLVTKDGGKNWDWICETILKLSQQEDPAIGVTANGTILSGEFAGLMVSPDTGCSWSLAGAPLAGTSVVDLVVRKDAPHTVLAIASRFQSSDDAGNPTYATQILQSTDDGASFSAVGAPIDPSILVETIEVAPSDPKVVYVSGIRQGAGLLLASSDGAITWTEHAVPLDASHERAPFVAGVDPSNAQLVYVRTSGTDITMPTRLLVTKDGGATFTSVLPLTGPMQGFALTPDGATIYAGGPKDGLYVASRTDFAFTKKNASAIGCLAHDSQHLVACSNEASGFFVGTSTDDGASFTAVLHLSTIRGPLACASTTTAAACTQEWPAQADQLGISLDAGADGGGGSSGGSSKSCGCRVVGARAEGSAIALLLFAAAIARRKRA